MDEKQLRVPTGYARSLFFHAWNESWQAVFDTKLKTTITILAILIFPWYQVYAKRGWSEMLSQAWEVARNYGLTAGLFAAWFLLHLCWLTPRRMVAKAAKELADEKAASALLSEKLKSAPLPTINFSVEDTLGRQDHEKTKATLETTRETLAQTQDDLSAANEKFEKLAAESTAKLALAEERIRLSQPILQPLQSATATLEVYAEYDQQVSNFFMDRGGCVALCSGTSALLSVSDINSTGQTVGANEVRFTGNFRLNVIGSAIGKSIQELLSAGYLQCRFEKLESSKLLRGTATLILNGNIRLSFAIPEQAIEEKNFFSRDIRAELLAVLAPEKAVTMQLSQARGKVMLLP
jgi:hypothetical protein